MKLTMWLRNSVVALAAMGVIVPSQLLRAEQQPNVVRQEAAAVVDIPDVALGNGGLLRGVVVDGQGHNLAGSNVVVRQGTNELVRATTNKDGQFAVIGLKGGVYQVATNDGNVIARVWNQGTAPPAAKDSVMVVNGQQIVRGEGLEDLTWAEWALLGAVVAATITVPIVVGSNNHDENNGSSS